MKTFEKRNTLLHEVRSLDALFQNSSLTSVRFAKMDVEGYECNVLKGAKQTLKKTHQLKIEVTQELLNIQGLCKGRDDLLKLVGGTHDLFWAHSTSSHRSTVEVSLSIHAKSASISKLIIGTNLNYNFKI